MRAVITETGVIAGKHRRALDSTVLDDAVARQDTVTMLIAPFVDDVERFSAEQRWVTEWQYRGVEPLLLERADCMVWLDLPVWRAIGQVTKRTISRAHHRTVLWNGNVEPPLRTMFTDRDHIIRWAWRTRHEAGRQVADLVRDRPSFPIVRLRSHDEATPWLAGPLATATT